MRDVLQIDRSGAGLHGVNGTVRYVILSGGDYLGLDLPFLLRKLPLILQDQFVRMLGGYA